LPYRLTFNRRPTVVDKPHLLAGEAAGEPTGSGRWTLQAGGATVRARSDWQVLTSRAWMNALAPLLAPAFRWNHGAVRAAGARGLANRLGVDLLTG
jgi:hypothetical protein